MVQELTQDNLQEIVNGNDKVVVQYSATWCGNCRIMKPKFKKLASENENVTFVIADAEKFPESRKLADCRVIYQRLQLLKVEVLKIKHKQTSLMC